MLILMLKSKGNEIVSNPAAPEPQVVRAESQQMATRLAGGPMSEKRVRLKKGTIFEESQDRDGQWWRATVVKDTATVFKIVRHRIDAPSREAPWSISQSDAPRKAPAKKTSPVKKATPVNVAAAPATKITEKKAKRVLSPEARKTIAKAHKKRSAAQRKASANAAKGAVPASAKAAKKSAAKNPAGKKVVPKAAKPVESSTPQKKAK
jgi:hypothetical protein